MSRKPSEPSKQNAAKNEAALDRPFEPRVLRRAKKIAAGYRLILEPNDEVGFVGRALEMPTVFADGRTPNECIRATQEALTGAVATMLEMGDRPPAAASQARRQAQINIRVSAEEKLLLEETARLNGFRGVSDFVRYAALSRASNRPASE